MKSLLKAQNLGIQGKRLVSAGCAGLALLGVIWTVVAQGPTPSADGIWSPAPELAGRALAATERGAFRVFRLNPDILDDRLAAAERAADEKDALVAAPVEITLPMPDGKYARFEIVESSIMAPALAAKFPEIKTYAGRGVDDPAASVRFDQTPIGFSAQILSPNGAVYIDPLTPRDTENCVSYYKRDYLKDAEEFHCHVQGKDALLQRGRGKSATASRSGTELRTYRLAVAANGEYTTFHGGTVALGQAAVVTAINRVTGIYETELSVRLELVANNNLLIYTDPGTDPYDNTNASLALSQNQTNIDAVIGNANYDIGHVFTTGSGGLASLGSVGVNSRKAQGTTGLANPTGDVFFVDFVAHEIGHQFGGNHTFNGDSGNCAGGNRNGSTAYEPGSGATIQAYAGICGDDNLQPNSDPYFHSVSFDEMINHVDNVIPAVGTRTVTGNNIPTVNAGGDFTIPARTPFALTASGSDADIGDTLTYNWEQRDLGPQQDVNAGDNGTSPLFRSWTPMTNPVRTFPRLSDLIANTTVIGETLPTMTRTMNFRATVRDGRAGGGGVNTDDMVLNVVDTGAPFLLTAPDTAVTWTPGTMETVTWNVAGTTANGINAANVDILLSTDGGMTYPVTLALSTPNDGTESISVPNLGPGGSSQARVKVQGSGNVFFDISNTDFNVAAASGFTLTISPSSRTINAPGSAQYTVTVNSVLGFSDPVTLSLPSLPAGVSGGFSVNPVTPGNSSTVTINATGAVSSGVYGMEVAGSGGGQNASGFADLVIAKPPEPVTLISPASGVFTSQTPTLVWSNDPSPVDWTVEVDDDLGFGSPEFSLVTSSSPNATVAAGALADETTYYWRVTAQNALGSTVSGTRSFTTPFLEEVCQMPNVAIPDANAAGVSDTLIVAAAGTILDLDLELEITHTWVGDLVVKLEHVDTGTMATFVNRPGGGNASGNNMDIVLDDEATLTVQNDHTGGTPAYVIGEHYLPDNALSIFDGESLSGTWRLTVSDNAGADTGTLVEWCLRMATASGASPPPTPDLTDASDTGASNSDNVTRNATPTFEGTARPGAVVTVKDGGATLGTPTADLSGDWSLTVGSALADGVHSITAEADGSAASAPLAVTIDTAAPTLTVNQASGQGDPATAGPVLFTAAFNESVSGFTNGDVVLGGSAGPTTRVVTEVAPNDGTTFQISVDGLANDGLVTASVNAAVAQDLAGNDNAAATSSDNSVAVVSNLAAPGGVQATDSDFSDKIRVTWNAVATAQNYDVYRHTSNDFGAASVVATVAGTQFDDTSAAADPASWFYWVVAKKTVESVTRSSPPGGPDAGQRAADQHGNTPGTATGVTFGPGNTAEFNGTLEMSDVDYFEITLTAPRVLRAYSTGSLDTIGSLFDASSQLLNSPLADDDAGAGFNFATEMLLRAGTYYVAVSGFGGSQSGSYAIHLELTRALLINEIDADDEGVDDREFVELSDGGGGNTDLTGLVLVFFDGATDLSVRAIDLDGRSTDSAGYFVAGNTGVSGGVDVVFPGGTLPDGTGAVALYEADATAFPNGTAVTSANLFDAVVYTTNGGGDDLGLLSLLLPTEPQLDEDEVGNGTGHSLQRLPNFSGDPRTTSDFEVLSPTPGVENTLPGAPTVPDLTTPSDSGSSQTDGITNVNLPTFTGTARAGSLVTISDLSGDLGTVPADVDGNWSFTVSSALADDDYSISATADKHAGGGASLGLPVAIDTEAPPVPTGLDLDTGSDSGVLNNDNITNVVTPQINGDEAENGVTVILSSDQDGDVGSVIVASPWDLVTDALSENVHQLVARATDLAGNTSSNSAPLAIQIDLTRPTVTIDQAAGQLDPAAAGPFQFTASFSETVHGFVNGDITIGGTAGASLAAVSGGPASFDVAVSGALQEGTVIAAINASVAVDTAGNPNFAANIVDNQVDFDQFGGNSGSATNLPFVGNSATTPGALFAGDMDFFEFTLSKPSEITVRTTGSTGTRGSLFDINDVLLNDPDADAGAGTNFSITDILPAGTYRVDVEGKTGTESGVYDFEIAIDRELNLQPDLMIGKSPGALLGPDFYTATGIGQLQVVVSKRLKKARYFGLVGNDGDAPDDLIIGATRGNKKFKVIYLDGAGNVTGAMVAGIHLKSLPPGAGDATQILVKPSRKLKNRKTGKIKRKKFTATVSATSRLDPVKRDVVQGLTKTK